jgi:hypothetical protein
MRAHAWRVYSDASTQRTGNAQVAERAIQACRDIDILIIEGIEKGLT